MSVENALIMAAGRGIRMGPRGTMTPKGLLEIGGIGLVQRSVNLLQARGVPRIRIVTGHLDEQYQSCFAGVQGVELIHNPDFDTTGSLLSMLRGMDGLSGSVALLESDIIYEARTLSPIQPEASTIVVSGETLATDEVYIWSRVGRNGAPVFETMSKDVQAHAGPHFGELVGVSCFTQDDVAKLIDAAHEVFAQQPKADYESAVVHMARNVDIALARIDDLAWTEMDDEPMFQRAINTVWPQILKNDAQS